jgi:hypothetical protein
LALRTALIIGTCMALIGAEPAFCHDFWIEPEQFRPEPGLTLDVRLREGVDFKGNTLPFIPDWFSDFSKVTAAGRSPVESMTGDDPAATITTQEGALLLGYRSNRNFVSLEADKFNNYLKEEGIEFIREQRIALGQDNDPAPEYFIRCAKVLIQSGKSKEHIYKTELGYILELIAENDPYLLRPGDELIFRLIYRGKPAANLLVQAFTRENPELRQRIRTDSAGRATIQLTKPGVWMVKAVNIQPIIGDPKAAWQSYWASYVFELASNLN